MNIASFRDELVRILEKRAGTVGPKVMKAVGERPLAAAALLLGGGALAHHEGSKAIEDLKVGRAYRKQMEQGR